MNNDTRVGSPVSNVEVAKSGPVERQTSSFADNKDKLLTDLKVVAADAETLIKDAADSSADGFAAARTKVESKLSETKATLSRARTAVGKSAKHATDATCTYMMQNPWSTVGVLAAAGLIAGILIGRRKTVDARE